MRLKRTYSVCTLLIVAPLLAALSSWMWQVWQDHSVRAKLDTDLTISFSDVPLSEAFQRIGHAGGVEIDGDYARRLPRRSVTEGVTVSGGIIEEREATISIEAGGSMRATLNAVCHLFPLNYKIENGKIQITEMSDPDGEIRQDHDHNPEE